MHPFILVTLAFEQGCDVDVTTKIMQAVTIRDAASQALFANENVKEMLNDDGINLDTRHCCNAHDIGELNACFEQAGGYFTEENNEIKFALDDSGVCYVVQEPTYE